MRDEDKSQEQLINELAQVRAALHESRTHFAGILEITHEAIISVNHSQHIILFNKGAEQIFGYSAAEASGQPLDILIPERYRISHRQYIALFATSFQQARLMDERQEIMGLRKNGQEFPAEASISKFGTGNNVIFTVVLRDITARKQAEQEREMLIKELDAFAHTVAHDIKDPIGLIVGYTQLLKEKANLPDELEAYLTAIARSGHRLNNIVHELQLLATARDSTIPVKPLHMARIVAEAVQRLSYLIEQYQARIKIAEVWPVALGHSLWVEEIWVNYLSNAIKYGGCPPQIQLGATERSNGTVRFWVRDNGPGLSPEAQARLFAPFTQVTQAHTQGYGLGLSIVKRIVDKLGGEVGVESEGIPGKGSLFTFTLPASGSPKYLDS